MQEECSPGWQICSSFVLMEGHRTHHAHSGVCLHLLIYSLTQGLPHKLLLCCRMRSCYAGSCDAGATQVSAHLVCWFHNQTFARYSRHRLVSDGRPDAICKRSC